MVPLVSAKLENAALWAGALFFPWGPLTDLLCEPGPYLLSEALEQNRASETDLSHCVSVNTRLQTVHEMLLIQQQWS